MSDEQKVMISLTIDGIKLTPKIMETIQKDIMELLAGTEQIMIYDDDLHDLLHVETNPSCVDLIPNDMKFSVHECMKKRILLQ